MDDQIIKDITAQINPYAIGAQGYEEAIIRDIETAAECTGTKVIIIDNLTYLCNSADKGVDVIGKGTLDLQDRGGDAELLVPEDDDISLKERCRRVNSWCLLHGKQNAILVSIHVNAYGNGTEWTQPHGWSIYTSRGKTAADSLATCIFEAAKKYLPDMQMRTDNSDGDPDFEEAFYILRHSLCPAVLSENGFMTNEQECRRLQTRATKQAIVDLHVEGITEYLLQ